MSLTALGSSLDQLSEVFEVQQCQTTFWEDREHEHGHFLFSYKVANALVFSALWARAVSHVQSSVKSVKYLNQNTKVLLKQKRVHTLSRQPDLPAKDEDKHSSVWSLKL